MQGERDGHPGTGDLENELEIGRHRARVTETNKRETESMRDRNTER